MIAQTRLYKVLALTGTLPFLASAVIAAGQFSSILPAEDIAGSYGLAILSFLAGVHWATYLYRREELGINLLAISNIVVVTVWIAYLAPVHRGLTLAIQVIAFLYLLHIDRALLRGGLISDDYFNTRLQATIIAVISLLVVIYCGLA
jgi:hypothetical protein